MIRPLALTLVLFVFAFSAEAGELSGKARAIDGDTMEIGGIQVRLYAIDAPELKQTCTSSKGKEQQCGDLARQMLDTLVKNVKVKCKESSRDKDRTIVASCFAGPFDINEQMVASGWALPLVEESDIYLRAEKFARARLEGMWRGTFIPPWQWRKENGLE